MFLILLTISSLFYNYESYPTEESCDWDLYFCEYYNPYPVYYTYKFKCNHHLNCPENFKCCQHHCFRHKICQPYRKTPAKLLTPFAHRPDVPDKPGVCDVKISCDLGFSSSLTRHFECLNDYACPDQYKCCYIECWGHRVCQPLKEVASTITITVPVESYTRKITDVANNLETTRPPPITLRTFEYEQTSSLDSISIESTTTTNEEPGLSNFSEIGYNTTMYSSNVSNAYTDRPDDLVITNNKSTTTLYNSFVEEELYTGEISTNPDSDTRGIENSTNSTTVVYVTVLEEDISSSINPKHYSRDNKTTTNADSTDTTTTITITNDFLQANDTIITTISYNASITEEDLTTGNVLTTIKTDTRGMEDTVNFTTVLYLPEQNISSSIKPNHNNISTNNMTTETTNNNATINNTTTISDVPFIKEVFTNTTVHNVVFDRYGRTKYEEYTSTTEHAHTTTNVNNNNFTTISYDATVNEGGAMNTDTYLELKTIIGEMNSALQNVSSIQEEKKTTPDTILAKNLTVNPINIDNEDTDIVYSGDGDPEQIIKTDDEDNYIEEEYNDDKPIWF